MKLPNTWTATIAALLLVSACNDATGPGTSANDRVVAISEYINDKPVLFIQDADGSSRTQVHFDGATDNIEGNVPDLLPVEDSQIKAIGPMEWSPDGESLAVVLTLAFDQSQVVIINRNGTGARTASPNTQIILSDVAWSKDGRKIAYAMSTRVHAQGVDMFTTDLATNRVTRLTTTSDYGLIGVVPGWSDDGGSVLVSRVTDIITTVGVDEYVSRVDAIDIATGARTILASGITGLVQSIPTGRQPTAITLRSVAIEGVEVQRRLFREDLLTRTATALTTAAPFHWADQTQRQGSILTAENTAGNGETVLRFRLLSAAGNELLTLRGIESGTAVVEVY